MDNDKWVSDGNPYESWYFDQNEKDPNLPDIYFDAGFYFDGDIDSGWTSDNA